ncbi:sugar transferase [Methylophaga sp.]|uniref:sugar transferase n=1 Tax=Methylophaga sp. TaxID=2024840 RepID=UPI0025D21ECC|nr:sugar transferase [Methylophaga sp.]
MSNLLAPIALFVYNRPEHTRKTVEALLQNVEAGQSDLFVFSDAPKKPSDRKSVIAVREYIHQISGFSTLTVIERPENFGLAKSIIGGVTQLCERFGRVIVLEDDLLTSPGFLSFMNKALVRYQDDKQVWHISGWNYPIETDELADAFFWKTMNCWGWATWQDRWKFFEKKPQDLIARWTPYQINAFNLDGAYDFWYQVVRNQKGKLNTWAIFWYATIFDHAGLCLNPVRSYVVNIGHDGTGENCRKRTHFSVKQSLSQRIDVELPDGIYENEVAILRIKDFLIKNTSNNLLLRLIKHLKRYLDRIN